MKVSELIELLQQYPADTRVVVGGYEGGVEDLHPESLQIIPVKLNANDNWYYGAHEPLPSHSKEEPDEHVLLLRR